MFGTSEVVHTSYLDGSENDLGPNQVKWGQQKMSGAI